MHKHFMDSWFSNALYIFNNPVLSWASFNLTISLGTAPFIFLDFRAVLDMSLDKIARMLLDIYILLVVFIC